MLDKRCDIRKFQLDFAIHRNTNVCATRIICQHLAANSKGKLCALRGKVLVFGTCVNRKPTHDFSMHFFAVSFIVRPKFKLQALVAQIGHPILELVENVTNRNPEPSFLFDVIQTMHRHILHRFGAVHFCYRRTDTAFVAIDDTQPISVCL